VTEISNWKIIKSSDPDGPQKIITHVTHSIGIDSGIYNYALYIPVVLIPISKSSTLVLSMKNNPEKIELMIHDLRLVDNRIVSSISFRLRGSSLKMKKFKNEMNRIADEDRCIGISFFLRKLFYAGFSTIYSDKILKPKKNSSLRAALAIVENGVLSDQSSHEDEAE